MLGLSAKARGAELGLTQAYEDKACRAVQSEDKACSIPWKGREAKHGFAAMLDGRTKALFRVIQLLLDGWYKF
uniref:Uncharacterized protein n=1 Tax=Oryza barthii TaxID=65489 RepID=A0A0D3FRM6_9ORYZ